MFKEGDSIDIAGTTVGKGFQGKWWGRWGEIAQHSSNNSSNNSSSNSCHIRQLWLSDTAGRRQQWQSSSCIWTGTSAVTHSTTKQNCGPHGSGKCCVCWLQQQRSHCLTLGCMYVRTPALLASLVPWWCCWPGLASWCPYSKLGIISSSLTHTVRPPPPSVLSPPPVPLRIHQALGHEAWCHDSRQQVSP